MIPVDATAAMWRNPAMGNVAFDTLKLARRLAAAGVPAHQADATAEALGETIGEVVVSRDHLDLRLTHGVLLYFGSAPVGNPTPGPTQSGQSSAGQAASDAHVLTGRLIP